MAKIIYYDPEKEPGTTKENGKGRTIHYVEPEEYYSSLLGHVMNGTIVFLNAGGEDKMSPERLKKVDDVIAETYWETYEACLLPPRVLKTILRNAIGPSGQLLLEELDQARQEIILADSLEEAKDIHADRRLQFLMRGAERYLTDSQVSVGEVMADYFLLQRAVAEDIRRAENEREEGMPRTSVLEKLDRAAELEFEKMLTHVLRPQQVINLIPRAHQEDIEAFASRRRPIFRTGVFAEPIPGSSGPGDSSFGGDDW